MIGVVELLLLVISHVVQLAPHLLQGRLAEAVDAYEKAQMAAPNFAIVHTNLAIALTEMATLAKISGVLVCSHFHPYKVGRWAARTGRCGIMNPEFHVPPLRNVLHALWMC